MIANRIQRMPEDKPYLPRLIATSVVRGSEQGDSHGGIFTVDFEKQEAFQHVDWNTSEIEFSGRGWDRGLRGIEFHDDEIYIAASDELFIYSQDFQIQRSFRNPYLKHCHEICKKDKLLFLTSTGYDSILVFDLAAEDFIRGLYIERQYPGWQIQQFSPHSTEGPGLVNNLHLNMVCLHDTGVYFSGLHTGALLHFGKDFEISEICNLPDGSHNARPFRDGVLFNDTKADCVRYVGRNGGDRAFRISHYPEEQIQFAGIDDSKIARQGFGRGLCPLSDRFIAGGSSPSTISVYDLYSGKMVVSVNLSMDIRNAIHGLEVWPYA